ncbi:MAG: DUF1573 domain-containing protein, partial [Bacteroidia bacterium]
MSFLVMSVVSATVFGQAMGPRIKFDTTTIDVGELEQDCNPDFHFRFVNIGDADLRILHVRGNDPMEPKWPHDSVQPGRFDAVTIRYYTHRIGNIHIYATVYTNDPKQPEVGIQLTGRIIPKSQKSVPEITTPDIEVPKKSLPTAQSANPNAQFLEGYGGIDLGFIPMRGTKDFYVRVKNIGLAELIWSIPPDPSLGFVPLETCRN